MRAPHGRGPGLVFHDGGRRDHMALRLGVYVSMQDLSKVKAYLQRQWAKIMMGGLSAKDFVFAKEVSGSSLSRARLKAQGVVSLAASHPDLQKFEYNLSNVNYRLVGATLDTFSADGNVISVPTEFRDNVKYIVVESADINTNIKGFKFETPLIIEVK